MRSGGGAALAELLHGMHNSILCGCYAQAIATMQQGWHLALASLLDAVRCVLLLSAAAGVILAARQSADVFSNACSVGPACLLSQFFSFLVAV
jgi:hypothetical protein